MFESHCGRDAIAMGYADAQMRRGRMRLGRDYEGGKQCCAFERIDWRDQRVAAMIEPGEGEGLWDDTCKDLWTLEMLIGVEVAWRQGEVNTDEQ
jgi:hypothetical protein